MKKIIFTCATLVLLAACNNKDKRDAEMVKARQATIDSVNMANRQQRIMDSISRAAAVTTPEAIVIEEANNPIPVTPPPTKKHTTPRKSETPSNPPPASPGKQPETAKTDTTVPATQPAPAPVDNTTVATTEEKKKKGLNNAAKGAIIGLGTGAAAGAVIGKENRGKGAVIGGVIGAIGGAVGGAVIDKNKAKKEAAKKDTLNKEEKK
jgi:outer membrane lipoprotein SlyB